MVLIILRCDILSFQLCIKLNKKGAFIVTILVSKKTKKPKTDSPKGTSGNNKPKREKCNRKIQREKISVYILLF